MPMSPLTYGSEGMAPYRQALLDRNSNTSRDKCTRSARHVTLAARLVQSRTTITGPQERFSGGPGPRSEAWSCANH